MTIIVYDDGSPKVQSFVCVYISECLHTFILMYLLQQYYLKPGTAGGAPGPGTAGGAPGPGTVGRAPGHECVQYSSL